MKLRIIAVLAVLALGTLASAQTFGFGSIDSGLYCNYEQLVSAGSGEYGGIDNLSACGASYATISGFAGTVANDGEQAHGAGVIYGDSIYAAYDGIAEAQWTVFSKLKCNAVNPKTGLYKGAPGWIGVAAFYGEFGGSNYGFLSCSIPGKGAAPNKGVSIMAKKRK